jgi:chromosome segregation protein
VHLKTITLVGFKSFANRTRIECEPGVTVVVGPNGTGKSNLVDAIAWAMGTQATTALRTQRMDDVIFAGTAVRPALGRAEVSLTFDNGSGALPVDVAEVTVTRRLLRDGTSEYEINGAACRLLDIQEMLADSGVGRHQHVIVGQGRIDDVLAAGPDEHRAVIEEAAGVIKHRRRRERALRRLEATDQDVQRAHDLLDEQRKRVRPLSRQARAAERHAAVREQWRSLRLWLGGEQLRSVRARRATVADSEQQAQARLAEAMAERDALGAVLAEMQEAAGEAGRSLERDRVAAARLETTAERLQSIALVSRERRLAVERGLHGEAERRRADEAERSRLEERLRVAVDEERRAVDEAERAGVALRALEDEERSLVEADRLPREGMAANFRGDLAALESAAIRDDRERVELTRRRETVSVLLDEEHSAEQRLAAGVDGARKEHDVAVAALGTARGVAEAERRAAEAAEERWRAAEAAVAAARARLETLEGAGLPEDRARAHAAAAETVVGTVSERLDVPDGLQAAIAAALGRWAAAYVADDPAGAAAAAGSLKTHGLGGVSFVTPAGSPAAALAPIPGAQVAIDLLGPAADAPLAATLLADVVIVDDLDRARSVVAEHPSLRAVTRSGDLVTSVGIALGPVHGPDGNDVETARAAVDSAVTHLARTRSRVATSRRAAEGSSREERGAADALHAAARRVDGLVEAIRQVGRSQEELRAELSRLDTRLGVLAEQAAARAARAEELRRRIAGLEGDVEDAGAALEELARSRAEVAARHDAARERRESAASAAAAAAERRALLERRLTEMAAALADGETVDSESVDPLASIESWARRAGDAVRSHIAALRSRERAHAAEVGEVGSRLEAQRDRRERLMSDVEATREELASLAVESTELRVREEGIAEALRRDVDATEDRALAAPRPDLPDDVDAEAHLESLAASMRRMGPVNPLAADEYRELTARVEFMEEQLADLEQSRAELRKVIRALDEEIARLFEGAFDDVAATFSENVELLFPGGAGRMTLTDPSDPLTTGVELHAQPMGKKVGRLALLSGGERSLAALAFLFAVFRARPSPFYVLDEVEAALDDANLRRFIRLVSTLRDEAQLVIVTHQQQTMEAADVLYGVTMEPGETSRVIAKRLTTV